MKQNSYSIVELLQLNPMELGTWLAKNYLFQIPVSINTVDDLKIAGELLGRLTNSYSYINTASTFANMAVRDAKRKKLDKQNIDDCISRRDLLETFADTIKAQYNAVSRMITVKKQMDDEMRMI